MPRPLTTRVVINWDTRQYRTTPRAMLWSYLDKLAILLHHIGWSGPHLYCVGRFFAACDDVTWQRLRRGVQPQRKETVRP